MMKVINGRGYEFPIYSEFSEYSYDVPFHYSVDERGFVEMWTESWTEDEYTGHIIISKHYGFPTKACRWDIEEKFGLLTNGTHWVDENGVEVCYG